VADEKDMKEMNILADTGAIRNGKLFE